MTIYIAGKITGDPGYKEKFEAEKQKLHETFPWAIILNPAEIPEGLRNHEYMRLSFAMIDSADLVVFLPDWEDSRGARLEKAYCEYTAKAWVEEGGSTSAMEDAIVWGRKIEKAEREQEEE